MHSYSRELPDLHKEVKEIMNSIKLQSEELKTNRKQLLDAAKKAQDLKCVSSLRSGYFLHISAYDAQQISQLPFVQPENFHVVDRLIELTDMGSLRNEINKFLAAIYKYSDALPEILANLPTSYLKGTSLPFLPEKTLPQRFLAFSTLPALFGHCWTADLSNAYINFLMKICEKLPPSDLENINGHWIFDCFTHYIHSSDITQFLRTSLGDILLDIIRDEKFSKTPRNAKGEYFNSMISYIEKILIKMNENMDIFPRNVRALIRKFADMAPDDAKWLQRVEILFCKAVLAPAISMPKMYCVLPQTFNFKVDSSPANALRMLATLFLYILHPSQAKLRHDGLDHEKLSSLPFESFLRRLADVDYTHAQSNSLNITNLMPVLGSHNIYIIFSIADIFMLSHCLILVEKEHPELTKCFRNTHKLSYVDLSKFTMTFFRHELWDLSSISLKKPRIKDNEIEQATKTPENKAAKSIFNFLNFVDEITGEPGDLDNFISFFETQAKLSKNDRIQTYIEHIKFQIAKVDPANKQRINSALEDEIRRQKAFAARISGLITDIAIYSSEINYLIDFYKHKNEDALPVFYEHLFDLFRKEDDFLEKELANQKQSLLKSQSSFNAFFKKASSRLEKFIAEFGSFNISVILNVMHTWILQQLSLSDFKKYHGLYTNADKRFLLVHSSDEEVNKSLIKKITIDTSPENVRKIFNEPELFDLAQKQLSISHDVEIPIESVKSLQEALDLLQKIFDLSNGCKPSKTEFLPLVDYLLLTSDIPDIYSFIKYLEHFLSEDICLNLIGNELFNSLTTFVNRVMQLDLKLTMC